MSTEVVALNLVELAKYVGNDMSHQIFIGGIYYEVTFDNNDWRD